MYACMISYPLSAYACYSSYRPTGHPESRRSKDTSRGRLGYNHKNYIPLQWHNVPIHRTVGCLFLRRPVQKKKIIEHFSDIIGNTFPVIKLQLTSSVTYMMSLVYMVPFGRFRLLFCHIVKVKLSCSVLQSLIQRLKSDTREKLGM